MPSWLRDLYPEEYFSDRQENDIQRRAAFDQDGQFVRKFLKTDGSCLDVGCGTGEFLHSINWKGKRYGIEISDFASRQAELRGFEVVSGYLYPDSLDAIFYRGTIQHLDSPFRSLEKAFETLRPGGLLFLLSTPNIESITYKVFSDLPALDESCNFYLPGKSSIRAICSRLGFELVGIEFPYTSSPYRRFIQDHLRFAKGWILRLFGRRYKPDFAFWGSMMNMAFRKPLGENVK